MLLQVCRWGNRGSQRGTDLPRVTLQQWLLLLLQTHGSPAWWEELGSLTRKGHLRHCPKVDQKTQSFHPRGQCAIVLSMC